MSSKYVIIIKGCDIVLYKKGDSKLKNNQAKEFIFDTEIFNDDIDLKDIAALEGFYKKNNYLPTQYISLFLNYITYYTRSSVLNPLDDPLTADYKNKCSLAASINHELLTKMGFEAILFNVGDIMGTNKIHQLCMVWIPTMIDNKLVKKAYLLDPTFRQFCLAEENRYERYFEEERYSVRRATPHPGYFMKLDSSGISLAEDIIKYGYFEVTDAKLKRYFDSYYFYLKRKEEYKDEKMLGKEYISPISGQEYYDKVMRNKLDFKVGDYGAITTPLERIVKERNKLKNRLKYFISHKDPLASEIKFEDDNLKF